MVFRALKPKAPTGGDGAGGEDGDARGARVRGEPPRGAHGLAGARARPLPNPRV